MKKIKSTILLLILTFTLLSVNSLAQPSGGGPGDGGDPDVPIGGVEILLLAGAALGIKRIIKKKE